MKINKDNGEIYGLSLKYDKQLPNEITSLLSQSKELRNDNFKQIDKKTIQITLRSNDALDEKNILKDKDKQIHHYRIK